MGLSSRVAVAVLVACAAVVWSTFDVPRRMREDSNSNLGGNVWGRIDAKSGEMIDLGGGVWWAVPALLTARALLWVQLTLGLATFVFGFWMYICLMMVYETRGANWRMGVVTQSLGAAQLVFAYHMYPLAMQVPLSVAMGTLAALLAGPFVLLLAYYRMGQPALYLN